MFNISWLSLDCAKSGIIFDCAQDRFIEIIESYTDYFNAIDDEDDFIEYFNDVFPLYYLRSNPQKCKNIVLDLYDIARSSVIRYYLEPIYVYTLYHMIVGWCDYIDDLRKDKENLAWLFPNNLRKYLKENKINNEDKVWIQDWFCKPRLDMVADFEDTYDGDYTNLETLETAANFYIHNSVFFDILGVDLEPAFDLLPNDLRLQCLKAQQERGLCTGKTIKEYDFFVSHASEDKDAVAVPLAEALQKLGMKVWLDIFELKIGDSIRNSIDEGLSNSKYGIVIMSTYYFEKFWTGKELNALFIKASNQDKKIIIPVKHNISYEQISKYSPILADIFSLSTTQYSWIELAQKIVESVE